MFKWLLRRRKARRRARRRRAGSHPRAPRQHSRKPVEVYEGADAFCAGPRLELFAPELRPDWTSWGDEARKFDRQHHLLADLAFLRAAAP